MSKYPNHIAIIMDGNGRWAESKRKPRIEGHQAGVENITRVVEIMINKEVNFLTLFAFSTENWKRPIKEKNYLFSLLENYLTNEISKLHENNIKLKVIGNKIFSKKLNRILTNSEKLTEKNKKLQINLALNYGSKNEIVFALKKVINKKIQINEKNITKNLFTHNIPDPDIIIRTGNNRRLSNFLLWQLAYSEIYFEKKLWPDFSQNDYNKILNNFKKIKRNYGNI